MRLQFHAGKNGASLVLRNNGDQTIAFKVRIFHSSSSGGERDLALALAVRCQSHSRRKVLYREKSARGSHAESGGCTSLRPPRKTLDTKSVINELPACHRAWAHWAQAVSSAPARASYWPESASRSS